MTPIKSQRSYRLIVDKIGILVFLMSFWNRRAVMIIAAYVANRISSSKSMAVICPFAMGQPTCQYRKPIVIFANNFAWPAARRWRLLLSRGQGDEAVRNNRGMKRRQQLYEARDRSKHVNSSQACCMSLKAERGGLAYCRRSLLYMYIWK